MNEVTFYIICMAIITFATRYAFFSNWLPLKLNTTAEKILSYTAPCILTAMWIPIVFNKTTISETLLNPYAMGALLAIIFSLIFRQTLIVIILSISCFYLLRYAL